MRRLLLRVFYGPPDWVVTHTSARDRRAVGFWLLMFWLGPGFVMWFYWIDALWFVGLMSLVALWWTGLGSFGSETPVEGESEQKMEP